MTENCAFCRHFFMNFNLPKGNLMGARENILRTVTCRDVAVANGLELKGSDSSAGWKTAVRQEKTPSVMIYSDPARGWYDFGNVGAAEELCSDCIGLWRYIRGCDFRTALTEMGKQFNVPIDLDEMQSWTRAAETRKAKIAHTHTTAQEAAKSIAEKCKDKAERAAEQKVGDKQRENAEALDAVSKMELTGDTLSDEHTVDAMLTGLRHFGGEAGKKYADELTRELYGIEPDPASDTDIPDEAEWSDVPPEPPIYLIYPYIPAGKLTAISSRGGIGKGHFACLLAARASKGLSFRELEFHQYPEEHHLIQNGEATHTLYITRGEDSKEDIQTRYINSGGIRGYLHIINEDSNKGAFNINKLKVNTEDGERILNGLVLKYNAKIVIFDTMDKFLNADSNKQGEVQDGLTNLQSYAGKMGIAVLCVLHDRKGGSGGNMADKVAGSREWTDVPRSVLQMDFDPEDEQAEHNRKSTNRRVVLHTKANGEYGKTLRFGIYGTVGNSGARFPSSEDGYSLHADVSADDYEIADLRKTTVRAILKEKKLRNMTAEARTRDLKNALLAEAEDLRGNKRTRVKYSFEQFETKHGGKGIWGGEPQRIKALENISADMAENGVIIELRERGTDGKNGFAICIT